MLGPGATILAVTILVFAAAALVALTAGGALARGGVVRRRFSAAAAPLSPSAPGLDAGDRPRLRVDPARLGLDAAGQRRLRLALVRAGIFAPDGVVIYTMVRLGLLVGAPLLGYALLARFAGEWETTPKVAAALALVIVAYYLPPAWLSRRQRRLEAKYRVTFPDLLDMMVVCINAGLSLDAALDRVGRELGPGDRELKDNLDLMAGEIRAGRGMTDALKDLAERLGLREARSLASLLQQTLELGTDVALALTTFSDEMRDRRMARAEEAAASLPPKLTLPLGLFIFPVVLIVILTPAVMRVLKALEP